MGKNSSAQLLDTPGFRLYVYNTYPPATECTALTEQSVDYMSTCLLALFCLLLVVAFSGCCLLSFDWEFLTILAI